MSLQQRQKIIQEKRKQTTWEDYIHQLASWLPLVFYKIGEGIAISRYPKTDRLDRIVSPQTFEDEKGDFLKTWPWYQSGVDFFDQMVALYRQVPQPAILRDPLSENVRYADAVWFGKNVYLSFIVIDNCENIAYSFYIQNNVRNCYNSVMVWNHCDNVYHSSWVIHSSDIFYSSCILNSSSCWFSTNLVWCNECLFCDGLENTSFHIHNTAYSKENYFKKKEELLSQKHQFSQRAQEISPTTENWWSKNVEWYCCLKSTDLHQAAYSYRIHGWRNVLFAWDEEGKKEIYDVVWADQIWEGNMYACTNMWTSSHSYCSDCCQITQSFYCFFCIQCSYCFWCVWLSNASYCILNKQYTKEERHRIVDEICADLNQKWTLWDVFPAHMNPFYYNDTLAHLILPKEKEEVTKKGYLWRDEDVRVNIPEWKDIVSSTDVQKWLLDWKYSYSDLPWLILSDAGWDVFTIQQLEAEFLEKYQLPLPELHWLKRIKSHMKWL